MKILQCRQGSSSGKAFTAAACQCFAVLGWVECCRVQDLAMTIVPAGSAVWVPDKAVLWATSVGPHPRPLWWALAFLQPQWTLPDLKSFEVPLAIADHTQLG